MLSVLKVMQKTCNLIDWYLLIFSNETFRVQVFYTIVELFKKTNKKRYIKLDDETFMYSPFFFCLQKSKMAQYKALRDKNL